MLGDYGYQMDTGGTGITYEDYLGSVVPGTEMPRDVWDSLPDPPSIANYEELQNIRRERAQHKYAKHVGGVTYEMLGNSKEHAPTIYQVYADPYLNAGTAAPHNHNPAGKSWL